MFHKKLEKEGPNNPKVSRRKKLATNPTKIFTEQLLVQLYYLHVYLNIEAILYAHSSHFLLSPSKTNVVVTP